MNIVTLVARVKEHVLLYSGMAKLNVFLTSLRDT